MFEYRTAIGQDSHRFENEPEKSGDSAGRFENATERLGDSSERFEYATEGSLDASASSDYYKPLVLGGIIIPEICGLEGNSDADVVFHALTNAISGISCINILGAVSDEMCLGRKITDSQAYLEAALNTLGDYELVHISISIECKRPKITPFIEMMRENISKVTHIPSNSVGITATSGEGLTDFGRGQGIQVFCIITVKRKIL